MDDDDDDDEHGTWKMDVRDEMEWGIYIILLLLLYQGSGYRYQPLDMCSTTVTTNAICNYYYLIILNSFQQHHVFRSYLDVQQ